MGLGMGRERRSLAFQLRKQSVHIVGDGGGKWKRRDGDRSIEVLDTVDDTDAQTCSAIRFLLTTESGLLLFSPKPPLSISCTKRSLISQDYYPSAGNTSECTAPIYSKAQ